MSYFTLSSNLGNPNPSDLDGTAPRKPKASFMDFLNQSAPESNNDSLQSSPEKDSDVNQSSQSNNLVGFSLFSSFNKPAEEPEKIEEKKAEEKRPSVTETQEKSEIKRESIKNESKRDSTKSESKRESIKIENRRESGDKPPKKDSLKNEPPQKRESIKEEEAKRESVKDVPEPEKRESIKNPPEEVKQANLTPGGGLTATNANFESQDQDELPHPMIPKSPMHKSGIPFLKHSYTIVEHKVDFPTKRETPYVPKYSDDTEITGKKGQKGDDSNESWSPTRKKTFQKSRTMEMKEPGSFKKNKNQKKDSKFKDLELNNIEDRGKPEKFKPILETQTISETDSATVSQVAIPDENPEEESPEKKAGDEISFAKSKNADNENSQFNSADYPQIDAQKEGSQDESPENEENKDSEEENRPQKLSESDEEEGQNEQRPKQNQGNSQKTPDIVEPKKAAEDGSQEQKKDDDDEDDDDDDVPSPLKQKKLKKSSFAPKEEKPASRASLKEGGKSQNGGKDRSSGGSKKENETSGRTSQPSKIMKKKTPVEQDSDDEEAEKEEIQHKEEDEEDENEENDGKEVSEEPQRQAEDEEEVVDEDADSEEGDDDDEDPQVRKEGDEEEKEEGSPDRDNEEEDNERDQEENENVNDEEEDEGKERRDEKADDEEDGDDGGNDGREDDDGDDGEREENENEVEREENENDEDEDAGERENEEEYNGDSGDYEEEKDHDQRPARRERGENDTNDLDEGTKERKKKYIESLTQNYLDKISRHDKELNPNNISYKIINEMLNNEKGSPAKRPLDEASIRKQIESLDKVIESKKENLNIINSDYQNHVNSLNININNESTLKSQLAEYQKILNEIDQSLFELTSGSENSRSKATLLDELRLKREAEAKLSEDYKYLIDKTRLLNETRKKKEKDINREFQPKSQEIEKKLETLRNSKLTIHSNLNSETEQINQLLENKAFLKEDLNGKLLQRAELVAQREELDQVFEDFQENYQKDIAYFAEETELKTQLAGFQKKLADVTSNKKMYQMNIDNLLKSINMLSDKLQICNKDLSLSTQEKSETLNKIVSEKEKAEMILLENFNQFNLPELEKLLDLISRAFSQTLDKIVLMNQMRFVEDEEEKMIMNYEIKCHHIEEKYNELALKDESRFAELQAEAESLRQQHESRRDAIVKWKEEVNNLLKGEKPTVEKLLEIIDREKNLNKLERGMKDKGLEVTTQNNLRKILKYYLEILQNYQTYYINKENQESEIRNEILKVEEEIDRANEEKICYEEKFVELEELFTKYMYSIKTMEQSMNEKKAVFEHNLIVQAENAYHDYLSQQSQTFEAINRTYGAKAAQHIKQEYYKQFLEIIRNTQQKRLEKFNSIKDDLKYLDDVIQFNISYVDNEILPQLKGCVARINEVKQHLAHLKREQIKILESEEVLNRELAEVSNEKKKKIDAMIQNLSNNTQGQDNEAMIENMKKDLEDLQSEIKELEVLVLEKDEEITELNQERARILREITKIQEKLDSQTRKNRKINANTENYKETPVFLTELKTSIIALEQEKSKLENQLLNYRSPSSEEEKNHKDISFSKKQVPKVYPNLFSDDYETPEMSLKQYQSILDSKKSKASPKVLNQNFNDKQLPFQKTLQDPKLNHNRAKSAPKNVNPQVFESFQNPDELIEELNYIANYSNSKLNESSGSGKPQAQEPRNIPGEFMIPGRSLQQNFEENLSYQRINPNNYSNEALEDDKYSSDPENNKNIFDLNQIPLNNPNSKSSKTLSRQNPLFKSNNSLYPNNNKQNNRSLSNEQKKQINVSIQSLMQEANGNSAMTPNHNFHINQTNLVIIKRCKFSSLHQDCNRHKKYFKFDLDSCSLKEIQFFESIKPLLDGSTILKKFTTFQSLKQPVFNPLTSEQCPPENCGYGTRFINLNRHLNRIEFRHHLKNSVENSISIEHILRPVVPQITKEILRIQKQFDVNNLNTAFKGTLFSDSTGNSSMANLNKNLEKMLSCTYYPFCLILEKGGRVELIAPNYYIFREWITGINDLIRMKKFLPRMRAKIETYCMLRTEANKNFL